ncbi:MAG: hypothetical protein HY331_12790 [Chloroflexi bacterium]|nr:hypothetical protein [Chloroflexota bacterium]
MTMGAIGDLHRSPERPAAFLGLGGPHLALWVWGAEHDRGETADRLLQLCQQQGVQRLYLHASTRTCAGAQTTLHRFLDLARACGVAVEFLGGDPSWALPDHVDRALAWVDAVLGVSTGAPALPTGLHLDVEPHSLGERWKQEPDRLLTSYLALLDATRDRLRSSGLRLAADIPCWYHGRALCVDGVVRRWSEHVQVRTHRVTVMAYRDQAPDIIRLSQPIVAFGSRIGQPVMVGVNLRPPGDEPAFISFAGHDTSEVRRQLSHVASELEQEPGFDGLAIHDYRAFRSLLSPGSPQVLSSSQF